MLYWVNFAFPCNNIKEKLCSLSQKSLRSEIHVVFSLKSLAFSCKTLATFPFKWELFTAPPGGCFSHAKDIHQKRPLGDPESRSRSQGTMATCVTGDVLLKILAFQRDIMRSPTIVLNYNVQCNTFASNTLCSIFFLLLSLYQRCIPYWSFT